MIGGKGGGRRQQNKWKEGGKEGKGREGESEMEVRKEAQGRKEGPQCMRDEED